MPTKHNPQNIITYRSPILLKRIVLSGKLRLFRIRKKLLFNHCNFRNNVVKCVHTATDRWVPNVKARRPQTTKANPTIRSYEVTWSELSGLKSCSTFKIASKICKSQHDFPNLRECTNTKHITTYPSQTQTTTRPSESYQHIQKSYREHAVV